jgi:putative ABC transport system permease protein
MVQHYIKFTLRTLFKNNKVFAVVNVLGLAISMLCCLFIAQYAIFELSYDKFHINSKNIYRISYSRYIDGEFQYTKAQVFPAVGETIKEEVSQIKNCTRLFPINTHIETVFSIRGLEKKSFQESSVYSADSSFLSIFSLPLIKGDSITALNGGNRILLSESAARKYFGDSDPINRIINWNGMGDWMVTGVFKDLPENSHMKFEFLVSWLNVYEENSKWNWDGFFTYILLEEGSKKEETEQTIQTLLNSKLKETNKNGTIESKFHLQPLETIHLESSLVGEMGVNGSKNTVIALLIMGIIIFMIALVNYTNLSLARIFKRTKEVGVRKVIGSSKGQIIYQFFVESLTINMFALSLALASAWILNDLFNAVIGIKTTSIILINPVHLTGLLVAITISTSFFSSIVPSRFLLIQNPITSLKGVYVNVSTGAFLKRCLLTFQFLSTAVLIAAAIIIHSQVRFMRDKELGFEIDQKLVIKTLAGPGAEMDSLFISQIGLFKNQTKELSSVGNATVTSNIPGRENEWQGRVQSKSNEELVQLSRTRIDEDFFKTFSIKLVAGEETSTSENVVVINESAARLIGFKKPENAIGNVLFGNKVIIGVAKDYNERSLHSKISPAMYTFGQGYMKFITVDIKSNIPETLKTLESRWKGIFPDTPFDYFFADNYFDKQYRNEERLETIFTIFSGISIFIACIGLFGFSYFVVYQRIKEIGIRKILGASPLGLTKLLTKEFIVLILIACTLAVPVINFLANIWLSEFAYKIQVGILYFIVPALIVLFIALFTINLHLIKVIRTNPVDSLKYE